MPLTLYVAKPSSVRLIQVSPPSWMVQLLLLEKEVEHELVELDFMKGEHRSATMLALNPAGTIPLLDDGSRLLDDSMEMLDHIDDHYPGARFRPESWKGDEEIDQLVGAAEGLKNRGMALFAYLMRHEEGDRDPEELCRLGLAFEGEVARWNEVDRADGPLGDSPTLLDLVVFVYLVTARQLGLDLGPYDRLRTFVEGFEQRPSVQSTWPTTWATIPTTCPWAPPGDPG